MKNHFIKLTVLLLVLLPAVLRAQFTYVTNSSYGVIVITGLSSYNDYLANSNLVIPSSINGRPVAAIGVAAFENDSYLRSVSIPDSVNTIGQAAFGYTPLGSVIIPDSVTNINFDAFEGDGSLTNVFFGNGLATLEDYAFLGCYNLKSVYFTGNAPNLGVGVFYTNTPATAYYLSGARNWTSTFGGLPTVMLALTTNGVTGNGLKYAVVNGTITITGHNTFGITTNLVIPAAIGGLPVTVIGNNAFAFADLASVTIPGSVSAIGGAAFEYTSLGYVAIPGSVTAIDGYAFSSSSLASLNISNGVSYIGQNTFAGTYLGNVTLPASVTFLDQGCFSGCDSLTNITFGSDLTNIAASAFYEDSGLVNATIPNQVIAIGEDAFSDCSALASVTLGASMASIGSQAFYEDYALTNITVVSSNSSFSSLNGVLFDKNRATLVQFPIGMGGDYTIPNGVTSIAANAFAGNFDVTSVAVPWGVTNIGNYAFYECYSLNSFYLPNSGLSLSNSLSSANATVCYYQTNGNAVAIARYTGPFTTVTIPAAIEGLPVTGIGTGAFEGNEMVQSVTIPSGVSSIGDYAFDYCYDLVSVSIPNTVINIGSYTFSSCPIYNVSLAGVVSLGVGAFQFTALTNVTFGTGLGSISDYAFQGNELKSISIPASITNIGNYAFQGNFLGSVSISKNVRHIGSDPFGNYEMLTNLTVDPANASYISSNNILYDKAVLNLIQFPSGVPGSFTVPGTVTNIGNGAFDGCGLTSVTFPAGLLSMGDDAFEESQVTMLLYFLGNVPSLGPDGLDLPKTALSGSDRPNSAVYEVPGTTGWGSTYGGLPVLTFFPTPQVHINAGVPKAASGFNFTVSGVTNEVIYVDASTNLATWVPVQTNTLAGTNFSFKDLTWTNYSRRFYRVRNN